MTPSTNLTDHDVVKVMITFGGSFVEQLGRLYLVADHRNKLKLKTAFPELWAQYYDMAALIPKTKKDDETT